MVDVIVDLDQEWNYHSLALTLEEIFCCPLLMLNSLETIFVSTNLKQSWAEIAEFIPMTIFLIEWSIKSNREQNYAGKLRK